MNYTLYNPTNDLDRLHSALKLHWIEEEYHYACEEYLLNIIEVEPAKAAWAEKLLTSSRLLLPEVINTADHIWNHDIDYELWHSYVAHGACHWMARPYLLLAEELFPASDWEMVVTDEHTAVIDYDNGIIFDLVFYAYGISPETVLEMVH